MKNFPSLTIWFVVFSWLASHGSEETVVEMPELGRHFTEAGVQGTIVLHDPGTHGLIIYNPERARERFLPASTFKIPNALIALDVNAVRDLSEVIPNGGTKEYFKSWEQDMTLIQAMKASNVAVFHQIARRVGLKTYRERLEVFAYGNHNPGTNIGNRFWLGGPLKISALEQVAFLRRLANGELPVEERSLELLKTTILVEKTSDYTLFAKTGWAGPNPPQIGWWVGWVQRGGQSHPFALNIDIVEDGDAPKRLEVARACLRELGWIE